MKKDADKKFVFVNLSVESGYYGVNHGIAYLAPVVRRNGFKVSLINLTADIGGDRFRRQIERLGPEVVGYSATSPQMRYLKKYSRALAGMGGVLQIAGGVGVTLDPEGVLAQSPVDGVVIGEGELPLEALLKALNEGGPTDNLEGFFWKRSGALIRNPVPQFVPDLSQLEYPDYSVFPREVVETVSSVRSLNLVISRGCPNSCHYCSNKALRSVYPTERGYFRVPPVEHAIGQLESVLRQYPGITYLNFEDDLLIARKDWFLRFAEEYRKRIGIAYRTAVRAEAINEEIVRALKESGCDYVFLGLECGNEDFRRQMLNRRHTNADILEKTQMIKAAGLKLFTFNMVGLPDETLPVLKDTIELNRQIESDCGACTFFYPFPGTALHDMCRERDLLKSADELAEITNFNQQSALRLTPEEYKHAAWAQKRLQNYFAWRDMIYQHKQFRAQHGLAATAINCLRLFSVYLLTRFSSPRKKNSLYRRVMDNRLRLWLWAKLFRRTVRQR